MPADLQQLSREGLLVVVGDQAAMIAGLQQQLAVALAKIAELKRRLGMNSSNSSRPPSSDDPFTNPVPKASALRGRSGRKPGKQPGAPGTTLRLVEVPDEIVVVQPDACACGQSLCDAPVYAMQRR